MGIEKLDSHCSSDEIATTMHWDGAYWVRDVLSEETR